MNTLKHITIERFNNLASKIEKVKSKDKRYKLNRRLARVYYHDLNEFHAIEKDTDEQLQKEKNLITYFVIDMKNPKRTRTTGSNCKNPLTAKQLRKALSHEPSFNVKEENRFRVERYLDGDLIFSSILPTEKQEKEMSVLED